MFKNIKNNYLAYVVIISGLLGFFAAFTLLLNRIEYYKNPDFVPPCSINPWLDCGLVMKSKWASLYGFPNTIIGLSTYPLAVMTGFIMLLNKQNNRVLMIVSNIIAGVGLITNFVLLYISAYLILALCPWCILAGVATSNVFFGILTYNIMNNHIVFKDQERIQARIRGNWDIVPVVMYYLFMFGFVAFSFFLRTINIETDKFWDPIFWLWGKK
jgi:uncharacterized membrane protein